MPLYPRRELPPRLYFRCAIRRLFQHPMRPFLSEWCSYVSHDSGEQDVHIQIIFSMKWAPGWMLYCMTSYTCESGICKPPLKGLIEALWKQTNKQYSQMEELLAFPGWREPNVVELPPMVCWTLWRVVVPCWPWYARASLHQHPAVTLHICVKWHHVGSWKFSMVEHLYHRNWKTPYMRFFFREPVV